MPVKSFIKLIKYIRFRYQICLPSDIPKLKTKKSPLILTFDDGYEDFYANVFPILKMYNIPCVLNVVVSSAETNMTIWTQRLNNILDNFIDNNINSFSVRINSQTIDFKISKKNAINVSTKLYQMMAFLPMSSRLEIINNLEHKIVGNLKSEKMMNWEQIVHVSNNGVSIGNHSYSHDILNGNHLTDDILFYEISNSKKLIENKIGKEIHYFAFPNGIFNESTLDYSKKIGYKNIFLVNEKTAKFKFENGINVLDRISIYSSNLFKNIYRIQKN